MAAAAAAATKSALFITPTHIAVQAVLHDVGAFKRVEFHGREYDHAH
jgi:hypothetical protein